MVCDRNFYYGEMKKLIADPDSVIDYTFNFRKFGWLQADESIDSHVITPEAGLTIDNSSDSADDVIVWMSGGTPGTNYDLECEITTDSTPPRKIHRSIIVAVSER